MLFVSQMRALLIKWSESILDIPVLVLQGYGGVTNPVVENEGDDVSSWGEEGPPVNEVGGHVGDGGDGDDGHDHDQPLMTQVETLDLDETMRDGHDKHLHPTEPTATTTKASGSPVTEEDRVILQKLGEIESPVLQRTVRKMPRSAALIAKDDADDANMDMEPLSTQAPEQPMLQQQQEVPLMTQPSEPAPEDGYVAGDENLEERKQGGQGNGGAKQTSQAASSEYIPSMRELLNGTDQIFSEVTDPDSIKMSDIFEWLSDRYGFKIGQAQRHLVVERLTELMVARNAPLTNGDNNAPSAAANAVSANDNDSIEETDDEAESDKASANGGEENNEKPSAKKRSAKRSNEFKSIEWPDSDSDSVSDGEYVSPRRSFKKAKTTRTRKAYVYADRKMFTEDEVAALREGIEEHGVGKWQLIINGSKGRLDGRSGVQVKDKYRTMLRSGKIGNPEPKPEVQAEQPDADESNSGEQAEQQDGDVAHI
jgi:hypothetical protein